MAETIVIITWKEKMFHVRWLLFKIPNHAVQSVRPNTLSPVLAIQAKVPLFSVTPENPLLSSARGVCVALFPHHKHRKKQCYRCTQPEVPCQDELTE